MYYIKLITPTQDPTMLKKSIISAAVFAAFAAPAFASGLDSNTNTYSPYHYNITIGKNASAYGIGNYSGAENGIAVGTGSVSTGGNVLPEEFTRPLGYTAYDGVMRVKNGHINAFSFRIGRGGPKPVLELENTGRDEIIDRLIPDIHKYAGGSLMQKVLDGEEGSHDAIDGFKRKVAGEIADAYIEPLREMERDGTLGSTGWQDAYASSLSRHKSEIASTYKGLNGFQIYRDKELEADRRMDGVLYDWREQNLFTVSETGEPVIDKEGLISRVSRGYDDYAKGRLSEDDAALKRGISLAREMPFTYEASDGEFGGQTKAGYFAGLLAKLKDGGMTDDDWKGLSEFIRKFKNDGNADELAGGVADPVRDMEKASGRNNYDLQFARVVPYRENLAPEPDPVEFVEKPAEAPKGINASAFGIGAFASGSNSYAAGLASVAAGDNSVSVGQGNTVTGTGSAAIGHNNRITGNRTFVLGANVNTDVSDSVGLGNGTVIAPAVGTATAELGGKTVQFAGTSPLGTVSVGAQGKERTITHVAAGRISESSTDAVNGSQLHAVAEAYKKLDDKVRGALNQPAEAGADYRAGSNISITDRTVSLAPDISGKSLNYTTGSVGAATFDKDKTGFGNKKVKDVADGEVSETSGDAVNGSQLYKVAKEIQDRMDAFQSSRPDISGMKKGLAELRDDGGYAAAGVAAMANIPQAVDASSHFIGAGIGHYDGKTSVAAGMSRLSENRNSIYKVTAAMPLGKSHARNNGLIVGAGYAFKIGSR